MTTLKQLWRALKADWAKPSANAGWITQQAYYDPERKIYIVGEKPKVDKVLIERYTQNSPEDTVPEGFHKCFHYDTLTDPVTGLEFYKRCQVYIKPVDNYCWAHRASAFNTNRKCKLCETKLFHKGDYCEYHSRGSSIMDGDGTHWAFEDGELVPVPDDETKVVSETDCGCGGFCLEHAKADPDFDNIVENIDETYVKRIGWSKLKYRIARKNYTMDNVHFRIECKGKRDDVDLFHAMLALCDNDYPLDPFRKNSAPPKECEVCKGHIWQRAVLTPQDMKKAAKQAGIRIKIREYLTDTACAKKAKAAAK